VESREEIAESILLQSGGQAYLLKKKLPDGRPNDRYVEGVCEALMVQPPVRRKS